MPLKGEEMDDLDYLDAMLDLHYTKESMRNLKDEELVNVYLNAPPEIKILLLDGTYVTHYMQTGELLEGGRNYLESIYLLVKTIYTLAE